MTTLFKEKSAADRKTEVKLIIERMAGAFGVEKKALHKCLGCKRTIINNWVYYGRVPYDYLEQCRLQTGASMDWLRFGLNEQRNLLPDDITEVTQIHQSVLQDGIDYRLIKANHDGAITSLVDKFAADLHAMVNKQTSVLVLPDKKHQKG